MPTIAAGLAFSACAGRIADEPTQFGVPSAALGEETGGDMSGATVADTAVPDTKVADTGITDSNVADSVAADAKSDVADALLDVMDTGPYDEHEILFYSEGDIWRAHSDGSAALNLTKTPASTTSGFELAPAWSPDRSKIAFLRTVSGKSGIQLSLMNTDGSGVVDIASLGHYGSVSAWTPDGRIVFSREWEVGFTSLSIIDAAGTKETRLTSGAFFDLDATVSPDGTKIAFASNRSELSWSLYVMSIDGTGMHRLLTPGGNDLGPRWSRDGKRIVFQREFTVPDYRIMTVGADGTGEIELTKAAALDFGPCWSPDGARLVFTRRSVTPDAYNIFTMKADGSELRQITFTSAQDPDW